METIISFGAENQLVLIGPSKTSPAFPIATMQIKIEDEYGAGEFHNITIKGAQKLVDALNAWINEDKLKGGYGC